MIDLDTCSVPDERLRDVARDPAVVAAAVVEARMALAAARGRGDVAAQQRLLGYLGNACRLLGQAEEAIASLTESLGLARAAGDARRGVVALIRLGEAHRCNDDYARAEALFREALALTRTAAELAALADFALQHLGKVLVDQGDCAAALGCLEQALALRQARGDPLLVASTERALAYARARCGPTDAVLARSELCSTPECT